jgi:hypothetical protein
VAKLSASAIAGIVKYNGASTGSSFADSIGNPDTDGPIFVAIALAESGGDASAIGGPNHNGSKDYGLWQINSVHKDLLAQGSWSNPNDNFKMAHTLYANRGNKFTDWSTYNNKTYAPFMAEATRAWGNPDTSAADHNWAADTANTTATVVKTAFSVGDFLALFTKSETWVRVGMGVAGALMLILVALSIVKNMTPLGAVQNALKGATA